MGLRPTKGDEDAVRKVGVGRRKRLPHVGSRWGRRFRLPTRTVPAYLVPASVSAYHCRGSIHVCSIEKPASSNKASSVFGVNL
jgi:hypothetical protein